MKLKFLSKFLLGVLMVCGIMFVAGCSDDDDGGLTMPPVPTAPQGELTERSGGVEISGNIPDAFWTTFYEELGNKRSSTYGPDRRTYIGKQPNGSGEYIAISEEISSQILANGYRGSETETGEYKNYSNEGKLYFGGGFGCAIIWEESDNKDYNEYLINGKINFNGDYKGTIVFQDFKYREDGDSEKHISGKIMISGIDVTSRWKDVMIMR